MTVNQTPMSEGPTFKDKIFHADIDENRVIAAIGYIFILFLVPLLFAKDSRFAQFHAKQGFALFILEVGVIMVSVFVGWIPIIGWAISSFLTLLAFVYALVGFVMALRGSWFRLPIVSQLAKRLNI